MFMVSGALALVGAFFGGEMAFLLILIPVLVSTLFLVIYSYVLYLKDTKA